MGFLNRVAARLRGRSAMLEAASPFRGWPIDRGQMVPASPLQPGLDLVRRRSQSAVVSQAYLARAADVWPSALVGAGITVASGHADPTVRQSIQTAFNAWGRACDAGGRLDWPGLQQAACRSMFVDGEALILVKVTPAGLLRLQQVPAERLDHSLTMELADGRYVLAGVEFSADGFPIAYHLFPRSPVGYAMAGPPIRFPASDVLHIFNPLAPGQARGLPWTAPVLITATELDELLDALLVGAKVSAMHAGFLVDPAGLVTTQPYEGNQIGSVLETGIVPGTMKVLPAGMDVKFSAPQAQAQGIELAKLNLQSISMGVGLPTHVLSGDVANANYSSLRAALLEWRTRIEALQYNVIIPQLVRPVWEKWLAFAELTGVIPDGIDTTAEFYPPAQYWIDPLKDAEAQQTMIASGLMSRRQAVAQQGYDVSVLDAEIAADRAREQALGLNFATRPAPAPGGTNAP
jgi:lambda family phage portal protein